LLTGEAGIGKTRCLNEFAPVARGLGIGVWTGRCLEGGWGAAFWPWLQVLRDALAEGTLCPTLAAAGRQPVEEELNPNGHAGGRGGMAASRAGALRFWVLEKVSRFLVRSAERT